MFINYSLSTCIANLGVVPLFSLAFFLSLPVAFVLFFLLILVCLVREPILKSFIPEYIKLFRKEYLTFIILVVKVISLPYAYGQNVTNKAQPREIFLARGEQLEIETPKLKSFSVGNKEVLRHSYRKAQGIMILKGSSIGFSDLVIWNTNKAKETYRVYVTSKKAQLGRMELLSSIKETSLEMTMSGQLSYVTGTIKTLKEYFIIKNLERLKIDSLFINVSLEANLRNKIYQSLYRDFSNSGGEHIYCQSSHVEIDCFYQDPDSRVDVTFLEKKYQLKMRNLFKHETYKNFHLKFTFYTMESNEAKALSSGLDQVKASLSKLISNSQLQLETTEIFAQNKDTDIKFTATQRLKVLIGKNFEIKIGTELPFRNQVQGDIITTWRFSGLKVAGVLKPHGNRVSLDYASEISAPSEEGISGPSGKSSLILDPTTPQLLFHLELGNNNQLSQGIPGFRKIPLLGDLFKSSTNSMNHKIVFCIMEVESI